MTVTEEHILYRCWKVLSLAPAGTHKDNVWGHCGGVLMALITGGLDAATRRERHSACVRMLIDAEDYLRNCVPAHEVGSNGVYHLEIVKELESKKRWSREANGWSAKK